MSKHLNQTQLNGLNKIGNILIPKTEDLPQFSDTDPASRVDRILDYTPTADLNDLKLLLTIFSFIPVFLLKCIYKLIESSPSFGRIGSLLRLIRLGIRGLVFSLYYSSSEAHQNLGYEVSVYMDDLKF